jgi:hypothetical protein
MPQVATVKPPSPKVTTFMEKEIREFLAFVKGGRRDLWSPVSSQLLVE